MNPYLHIYPSSEFTSQASISTKQSNFLSYPFNITPSKTLELFNLAQEKRNFNLTSNPFHNFNTSNTDFYAFPRKTKASTILGGFNIPSLKP